MPDENKNEIDPTTLSPIARKVLEDLKGKGYTPENVKLKEGEDGEFKDSKVTPPKEETPAEKQAKIDADKKAIEDKNVAEGKNPDGTPKTEVKVERTPKFVPVFKLKIAESQKESVEKERDELKAQIEKLSKKSELTPADEAKLNDSIEELSAKYPDVDPNLLKDLQNSILAKVSTPKEVTEALKELQTIKAERDESFESAEYSKDFEKDVLPLIKAENPNLSDEAILQIKDNLKTFAYTEEYAKIPLSKIFRAERDSLDIPVTVVKKKTTEGDHSFKTRDSGSVDFDNMTEEGYNTLPAEEKAKFREYQKSKNSSGWK
jgi:hypothetical protein